MGYWWLVYKSFTGLTITCKQAIVEISRVIVSNDTITPSDLLLFKSDYEKIFHKHRALWDLSASFVSLISVEMTCWGIFYSKYYDVSNFYLYAIFKEYFEVYLLLTSSYKTTLFPLYVISTVVERSHTFALAKVNVSQIHRKKLLDISL